MARSLYEEMDNKQQSGGSKKIYALAFVVIILLGVIGFFAFGGGVTPQGSEVVETPEQAADTLSGLGNDLSGLSDDLKEMENLL